jgi:hypothetical protein
MLQIDTHLSSTYRHNASSLENYHRKEGAYDEDRFYAYLMTLARLTID